MKIELTEFLAQYRPEVRNLSVNVNGAKYTILNVPVYFNIQSDAAEEEPFMTEETTLALHAHVELLMDTEQHPNPEAPNWELMFDPNRLPSDEAFVKELLEKSEEAGEIYNEELVHELREHTSSLRDDRNSVLST